MSSLAKHVTDVDAADPKGIAITGADTSHGRWEYTLNGGNTWTGFPAASSTTGGI